MPVYNSKSKDSTDLYFTPAYAIKPLIPFIDKEKIVWEPAAGNLSIANYLAMEGIQVIATDISTGHDFLTTNLSLYSYIITNPPYSLKTEFLERCFFFDKPFALLVPCDILVGKRRFQSLKGRHVQLIVPNKRIVFGRADGKKSCPNVSTMWLTYGMNLPNDIIFVEV